VPPLRRVFVRTPKVAVLYYKQLKLEVLLIGIEQYALHHHVVEQGERVYSREALLFKCLVGLRPPLGGKPSLV